MSQDRKNFISRDERFTCEQCQKTVEPLGRGCRNHCPFCLHSKHVDKEIPGDRESECGGLMVPIGLESGSRKGYLGFDVLHECKKCGKQIKNLLAEDDQWEIIKK
ncbi:MAG: RNHCP domain-containing protein [Candidatus Peregrinibacteria bacterium]|nr:RNHCP domain-containing protein [Candidatus Peregrinibacteria bacterium]